MAPEPDFSAVAPDLRAGAFLVIEGPDGVGKGTTIDHLLPRIAAATGSDPVHVREPGGTQAGERIRSLLKDTDVELDPVAQLHLFSAARRQLLTEVVAPALAEGRVVVADRFVLSTYAYQGGALGVPRQDIDDVSRIAIGEVWPDATAVLTLEPSAWRERLAGRGGTRDRYEDAATLRAALRSYLELSERLPHAVRVSASGTPDDVAERVFREALEPVLRRRHLLTERQAADEEGRRGATSRTIA